MANDTTRIITANYETIFVTRQPDENAVWLTIVAEDNVGLEIALTEDAIEELRDALRSPPDIF